MPTTPLTDPVRERLFKNRNIIISGEVRGPRSLVDKKKGGKKR